jgi:hypothetical protein
VFQDEYLVTTDTDKSIEDEKTQTQRSMNKPKKTLAITCMVLAGLAAGSQSVWALNITIPDGLGGGGTGTGNEVGETEPNTVNTHAWDNEAFVIQGNKLVLISGFDLKNGYGGFASGDLFINTAGTIPTGTIFTGADGYRMINGNGGYEYVMDLNVTAGTFNVVDISVGTGVTLKSGYYRQNDGGNPFAYLGGGTKVVENQGLTYLSGLTTAQVQAAYGADVSTSGNNNYVLEFDMSWFNAAVPGGDLLTHYTFGCANDVIVGQASGGFDVPDGGSTVMLLGLGMIGLLWSQRRLAVKA